MSGEGWATSGVTRLGISVGSVNTVAILDEPGREPRPLMVNGSPLVPSAALGVDGLLPAFGVVASELRGVGAVETVVSCPLGWDAAEREALVGAAAAAGLGRVEIVDEPVAAASLVGDTPWVLVVDVGAVTADVTLLRRTPGGLDVTAAQSLPDAAGDALDAGLTELVRSWVAASGGLPAWERLDRAETPDDENASSKLMLEIVATKEALSRQPSAALFVPLAEIGVTVPRVQFEAVATRVFEPVVRAVADALTNVVEQVTVLLIGGTSRVPVLRQLVTSAAGPYAVIPAVPSPELVIAEGCAAWAGRAATSRSTDDWAGREAASRPVDGWAGRHSAPLPQIEPSVDSSGRHTRPDGGWPFAEARHGRSEETGVGRRRRAESPDDLQNSGVFSTESGGGHRRAEPDGSEHGRRRADSGPPADSGVFGSGPTGLADSGVFGSGPSSLADSGVFRAPTGSVEDSGVFRSGAVDGQRRAEPPGSEDSGVFRPGSAARPVGSEDSGVFRSDAAGRRRRAESAGLEDSAVHRSGDAAGQRRAASEDSGVFRPGAAGGRRRADSAGLEDSGVFRSAAAAGPGSVEDSGIFRSDATSGRRRAAPAGLEDSGVFRSGAAAGPADSGVFPVPRSGLEDSGVFRSRAVDEHPDTTGRRKVELTDDPEPSGGFRAFSRPVSRGAEAARTGEPVVEEKENRLMVAGLGLLLAGLAWFPVLVVAGGAGLARFVPGVAAALIGVVLLIVGSGRAKPGPGRPRR
ncbi:Hsp70 family protein [Actinoplanes sp. TRM 88003]|uniref:Hsp70 family protein n=1 Tax=Paractinoplanes aksuensis TaxID=2939490 RepID=A0ABT1DU20_9ACTN|nr:Hsp70 family protein [Actinoplanes aksuensis]MCO8274353.1 Hsp70 family protein [Actinoplanes aksuensis]